MADLLRRSGNQSKFVTLNVAYLIRSACGQDKCSPDVAEVFENMAEALALKKCAFELPDMAKDQLRFLTESKQWTTTSSLLCNADLTDFAEERMRYAFAPDACRLATSYGKLAMAFFVRCRIKMLAPANTLAKWMLEVRDLQCKHSALLYIANGQLASEVAEQVRGKGWLADISPQSELLANFDQRQKDQILRALATQETIAKSWHDEPEIVPSAPPILQREAALKAISAWWQKNCDSQIKEFDREFWPPSIARKFDDESDGRVSWMTLFALGLMQRYGWGKPSQNRGFITFMHDKNWWHVFAMINPREDGQAWLNVLKEYGESQTENEKYSQWMDNFPRLYRVARWFDECKHAFLSLDQRDRSQTANYLASRGDFLMSGSGIDAPPFRKGFNLGQHIVIRELLRSGVLSSDTAKSLAFKPGAAMKQMLAGIGFDELSGRDGNVTSGQIYDVLRKCLGNGADFNNAYDIPLMILARNRGLQEKILGIAVTNGEGFENE
jgi:hypothetical protein